MTTEGEGKAVMLGPCIRLERGESSAVHSHSRAQLIYASEGVLRVHADDRAWTLPSPLALWVPPGVAHSAAAVRPVRFRGVYIRAGDSPFGFGETTLVTMPSLAHHVIDFLDETIGAPARQAAEVVLAEAVRPATVVLPQLRLPVDPRARDVAEALLRDPGDVRTLREVARAVGSSPRTLLRLFIVETGLTFSQWRTSARLVCGIAKVVDGEPIGQVALQVGYETPSSFTAAFRRVFGTNPRTYVQSVMSAR